MTASVTATFSPPKKLGRPLGRRTLRNVCISLAPIDRARCSMPGSTLRRPTVVSITIGKNAIRNAISTFGVRPKPNHTTNSGAIATFGTTCDDTITG